MKPSVKPFGQQVVVQPVRLERQHTEGMDIDTRMSQGGVALPDTVGLEPDEGIVVALGDGWVEGCPKCQPEGLRHHFEIRVGDRILYPLWKSTSINLDDERYDLIEERDICGILQSALVTG